MAELKQRFDSLSRTDAPDLWPDIERREPRSVPPEPRGRRVITAVVALALTVAGLTFAAIAFRMSPTHVPAASPHVTSMANGDIAFLAGAGTRLPGGDVALYVMQPDGNVGLTELDGEMAAVEPPAWSPNGTKLALVVGGRDFQPGDVVVVDLPSGQVHQLTHNDQYAAGTSWSADGGWIAYSKGGLSTSPGQEVDYDIYAVRSDGTSEIRLTRDPADDVWPAWSPDGTRIVFERVSNGPGDLWIMNADGSDAHQLTDTAVSETHPVWSPDGRWIAFAVTQPNSHVTIEVMRPDGSDRHTIYECDGSCSFLTGPTWSPDGRLISFSSASGSVPPSTFVMNSDGSDVHELQLRVADACCIAWQPVPSPAASSSPRVEGLDATYTDPLGWSMRYPEGWHVTEFDDVCHASFTGALVANVPDAYHSPVTENGCYWPPHMNLLPPNGVVVEFDLMKGGPGTATSGSPDTTFPLSFDDLQVQPTPGPGPVMYTEGVQVNGIDRYQLNVWIGSEASAQDQVIARQIVSSITFGSAAKPTGSSVSTSAMLPNSTVRCTATVPALLQPGEPTGLIFTFENTGSEPAKVTLQEEGNADIRITAADGSVYDTGHERGLYAGGIWFVTLAPGATETTGVTMDVAVRWDGPLTIVPTCQKTALEPLQVGVADPGPTPSPADALAAALADTRDMFASCEPTLDPAGVVGEIRRPGAETPASPSPTGQSVAALCWATIRSQQGFDVVTLSYQSPPSAPSFTPGTYFLEDALPPGGGFSQVGRWTFVVTAAAATSVQGPVAEYQCPKPSAGPVPEGAPAGGSGEPVYFETDCQARSG